MVVIPVNRLATTNAEGAISDWADYEVNIVWALSFWSQTRLNQASSLVMYDAYYATEVEDIPSDDVTDEPSDDVTDEPSDDVTDEPSDDVTDEPSDDVTDEPSDDVTEAPSDDAGENPDDSTDTADLSVIAYAAAAITGLGALVVAKKR